MSAYEDIEWYNVLVRTEGKTCDRVVFDEYIDAEHAEPEEDEQPGEKIVRCRDCKYASYDNRWCYRSLNSDELPITPVDFCSWGERKQDNEI